MQRGAKHAGKIAALALLTAAVISSALADTKSAPTNAESRKLCYCNCDARPGSPMCRKLCELPKYKDRWWATNCARKDAAAPILPAQQQNTHSRSRNGVQGARN